MTRTASFGGLSTALAMMAALLLVALTVCSIASAAETRPYTGVSFGRDGSVGTEQFGRVDSLAVDQGSGDVYVLDGTGSGAVYKFSAAGEPIDFPATGTNVIEGTGHGSEETTDQLAVAPVGSPGGTAGDIYVANEAVLKIYASSGVELGQIEGGVVCGVAVDPVGHLFVGSSPGIINEFVPSANPPTSSDISTFGVNNEQLGLCNVAAAADGSIYAGAWHREAQGVSKLEGVTDTTPVQVDSSASTIGIDPMTEEIYANNGSSVVTYAADGAKLSSFGSGDLESSSGVAIDSAGNEVYVGDNRVGNHTVKVFGPPATVPTVAVEPTTTTSPFEATLKGTVNPEGLAVTGCVFEYGIGSSFAETLPCEALPPTNSSADPVRARVKGLAPDGVEYRVRLVATNGNGSETSMVGAFTTPATVVTEAANPVGETTATLRGRVFPGSLPYTECKFEYGLTTEIGFAHEAECNPSAAAIPPGPGSQAVTADVSGLQFGNTTYKFRLSAENTSGVQFGQILTLTTPGPPQIIEVRARDATQNGAFVEGRINPAGFNVSWRFEWGLTSVYGHELPVEFDGSLAKGTEPVRLTGYIGGLSVGTTYHYRLVATNSKSETTRSFDQILETLNSCGLPEGRCFELVSPTDPGPVASPGETRVGAELGYQPSLIGRSLAYSVENGLPGATKGALVLYQATRHDPGGWSSEQISPSIVARNEQGSSNSAPNQTLAMSADLSCGVLADAQPTSAEKPAMKLVRESGGSNLYRREADGVLTPITDLAPTNPAARAGEPEPYTLDGMSDDCKTVAFTTAYNYPGVGAEGVERMYEWRSGRLRSVGVVPGPSGEGAVQAIPGVGVDNHGNVVSSDGNRIFFSATRLVSGNPLDQEEEGKTGIFVRENGTTTRDLSASETTTPDLGAEYLYATSDGNRVFFRANYGLTEDSSVGERNSECGPSTVKETGFCDLYEYDLEKAPSQHPLTDLSASAVAEGARVTGFVGASTDGSHVYFLAQSQLLPGEGKATADNVRDNTYSLYSEDRGQSARFVATVTRREALAGVGVRQQFEQTSRVSPSGRFLAFETSEDVTGYASGPGEEAREVYLYDAEASTEPVVCVSCRQDGQASSNNAFLLLQPGKETSTFFPRTLVVRGGQPIVFFKSMDPLTGETSEASQRVYEWVHDQVFLLAGARSTAPQLTGAASADGTDVFFDTSQKLSWEDRDERPSIYDARIGGGFAGPSPPPAPCVATTEGSCQGTASSPQPASSAGTARFSGPGNVQPTKKHHKKKHHKKKHHKKKHRKAEGRAGK